MIEIRKFANPIDVETLITSLPRPSELEKMVIKKMIQHLGLPPRLLGQNSRNEPQPPSMEPLNEPRLP